MSDYKPGTVVTATVKGRPNVRLVSGWSKYDPQLRWCELSPRWADGDDDECWFLPHDVTDVRPLVVLDPEDAEQVERLAGLLVEHRAADAIAHSGVRDALLSLTRPPRPPEPTGLGAVVEDAEGLRWVRHSNTPGTFPWLREGHGVEGWSQIDAVRILSEGVRP